LLDGDSEKGSIVASRGGKVSRKHYAHQLGCSPSALTRFGAVFAEYERDLGIATGPMRHFPEMRRWLRAAYETRELVFRDGKLDRTAFSEHFGLRGGTFITRHPPIRELFEEFDDRASREGYLPSGRQGELERVRAVLAKGPVLDKHRVTINLTELSKASRVAKIRFRDEPFADILAARQAEVMRGVKASSIDPFVHGRVFSFSELSPAWPTPFLERVGRRFKQIAAGMAQQTVKRPYLQLIDALGWMGANENPHCRAVVDEAKASSRITSAGEWEEALFAYRDHLIAGARADSSTDSAIKALRMLLEGLSSGGVLPVTSTPLPGVKHARRLGGRLRSVAEASARGGDGTESGYVAFARDRLLEASKRSGVEFGTGDSDGFIDSLAVEMGARLDLPADPVTAVRLVLERRLGALRDRATAVVDTAAESLRNGRRLRSLATIDGAEFERAYLDHASDQHERNRLVREFFPSPANSNDDQVEQGVANLLSLIHQRHGGVPPLGGAEKVGPYGQFFAKRYLAYGGLKTIVPMLHPDPDAVGAILTLYLIESGSNVSVGRTLDRDCMEKSDLGEHRRITGHKARAQGKPIIVDLSESSPAVRAIDWLRSAGEPLRAGATSNGDRLFLMRLGKRVQLMTPHWYTSWFKGFAASTPGLEGIGLVPNMLRPSVLLHAALADDGRLATGLAIGQHSVAVTQGYQQKWPTRLLYDENVRRFGVTFETLVMSGIEDAASKLGITVEQFEARLGDLRATGLGTFCRDHRGRPDETSTTCSTLDCWNDCPHLLVVAEVEAMAALQLWQASLRAARPEWERDRPERWDQVWLPWLCLTDVVEEKMARGSLVKVWNAAKQRAAEISAQPGYEPPRPW